MDLTVTLMNALEGATGVPCYPTVPADRPETFITVQCTGGSDGMFLCQPMFAVQSWAATQQQASTLAKSVGEAMRKLPYQTYGITHVGCGYPYPFPSTEKIPRYQALYTLTAHNS